MKIGIIREDKNPPDSRVPLDPDQCAELIQKGWDICVQKSPNRCFKDDDYAALDIPVVHDVSACDILLGVKEVPVSSLIEGKKYFFFSHTMKEQPYNRSLLQAIIDKKITLVDYEALTNEDGARVIAFGKFAGMVGAHNALWTYAQRTKSFAFPRMKDLYDFNEAKEVYRNTHFPKMKIVLTGTGRVATGAAQVLEEMGIKKIRPIDYVKEEFDHAVFTQINTFYYAKRKDGKVLDDISDFYKNPSHYDSDFDHFLPMSDIMINGIYWDNHAPPFFTLEQMKSEDFGIQVIADVTCDIAPISSIPATIKASTIADPVFGFDKVMHEEVAPYHKNTVDMMTIDNLPNEMPRDASTAFGMMFIEHVLPELKNENSALIKRATITEKGGLGQHYQYLEDYVSGK